MFALTRRRLLASAGLIAAGAVPARAQSRTIAVDASSTYAPLLGELARQYQSEHPEVAVRVTDSASQAAAGEVAGKAADIAFVDSSPQGSGLYSRQVFAIPLAVVIDPKARVTALSRAQVLQIWSGKAGSWSQLGGADLPIHVFTRPAGSTMSAAFAERFGSQPRFGEPLVSSAETIDAIRSTPGSVGITTLSAATTSGLAPVAIDGHQPAGELGPGAYPFYAPGYVVTNGPPVLELSRFLAFVETRRALLTKYGVVASHDLR